MSVYFALVGPVVKVGFSDNPERRLKHLFRGTTLYSAPAVALEHRDERRLLRAIEGDKATESRIHRALDDYSVGLEWFVAEQPVLDFAATVQPIGDHEDYPRLTRLGGPVAWPWDQMAGGNFDRAWAAHLKREAKRLQTAAP